MRTRVGLRVKPTTSLDKAALIHDVEYLKGNQTKADNNMWLNMVRDNPFNFGVANAVRLGFLLKDLIGYDVKESKQDYLDLRKQVEDNYDLGAMKFYEDAY